MMIHENICDLLEEFTFCRAKQSTLRAAMNEIIRLTRDYDDEMSHGPEVVYISDAIQNLEYACADIESYIVQRDKDACRENTGTTG